MHSFPPALAKVTPLYARRHPGPLASSSSFNHSRNQQHSSASTKVLGTSMYEPVSSAIIQQRYATRNAFAGDGGNEPPQKPPRRNKLRRQSQEARQVASMKPGNGDACIDIDHINIEANNYKNKFSTASVQTSPLVPYRLRFWPRATCDLRCGPDEPGCCSRIRLACVCRLISQCVLSQIGLTIIVLLWALLGALAFYKTEGPRELSQFEELEKLQKDLSIQLATDLRQSDEHIEIWPNTINKYLQRHEALLLEAVSAGFGEGGGGSIWTYPGCILFAVSLLTTLGFGAPVPRTTLGRSAAVLFSAVGIPLHFLLILNMGNLGAVKLQQLAARLSASGSDIPASPPPRWLKLFPFAAIAVYYLLGVVLFGLVRKRNAVDSLMFPLDFTAAGGVARTYGHVRILYALYLEVAVTLAALVVSLMQASATRGIVDVGLKLGLLINT